MLSRDRAKSVVDHLVKLGIDAARLEHEGYSKTRPLSTGTGPEDRARNRRVEFIVID